MVNIDFYGGVDEIGGNKILVSQGKTSLFLDFGMSFSHSSRYFSEFLQPRKANGIMDFIELGLLPRIKGIYREDYLKHCGIKFQDHPAVEGLLLSHAHMDHSAYIHHLREDIPIYMTEKSYSILKVLEDTSAVSFADMLKMKKNFYFTPKKMGKGYKRSTGADARVERNINVVKPYKTFQIGDFKVKSAPVDHSLPGASAYILECDDENIVYTGDLRFHGRNPQITHKFVKEAKKSSPNIMISEGTRIDSNSNTTEEDIEKQAKSVISDFKGLVIVNYPLRDFDRLVTFYNVAKETDRTLVLNLKQAYMLNLFHDSAYPDFNDVAVYAPRKGWGLVGDNSFACFGNKWMPSTEIDDFYMNQDYRTWERDFLDWENTINYRDLQEEPEKYIFRCDFFELKELIDIKPESGIYIRSVTEPFDEEMEIDYMRVKNWLDHFKLPMYQMHASGHASGPEILNMVREVNPNTVYPVHTEHREMFKSLEADGINVVFPKIKF